MNEGNLYKIESVSYANVFFLGIFMGYTHRGKYLVLYNGRVRSLIPKYWRFSEI